MEKLWCWRCKRIVPMLDEEEYQIAYELYGRLLSDKFGNTIKERSKDLIEYYFNLTGEMDTTPNSIMHHRIALYGPPCESCGKPYRTNQASFCAACGHKRDYYI